MTDSAILKAAGQALRKGASAAIAATMAVTAAIGDVGDRPNREQWIAIRTEQGRATPASWRETPALLGYQRKISLACDLYDVVFVEKSRRTGATWGAAADAVLRSASPRNNGGMDTLYMGTSHDMAKEFIDAAAMWSRLFEKVCGEISETLFDDGSEKGVQALKIDFASGFSIVALSSKPRSLRGRQGFAILDEAAFVDNLAELLKAALAFLMWGGKVLVISTHNGVDNPFNQTITDIRAGRKKYGLVRFDLDDALKDGLLERMCLVNAHKHGEWSAEKEADWRAKLLGEYGDGADEELYCIPSQGSGAWLPGPLIEARMVDAPVLRLSFPESFNLEPEHRRRAEVDRWIEDVLRPVMLATLDPNLMSGFGMDVGRLRDLTVMCPMQITRLMRRVVPFLVELFRVPFQQQEQIRDALVRGLPRFIGGRTDATGIGASLAESGMQKFGPAMVEVKLSTEWYRVEMPPVKAAFEDDMIAVPRDAEVGADLRAFKVVKGIACLPHVRTEAAAGGMRHGDAGMAIVLAYSSTRQPHDAYGYQSARVGADEPRRTGMRRVDQARDVMMPGRRDGLW
ncbi:terminase large subunit domain-containing protein [Bosea sp. MMO-172]|uniref:terminase large subunit domain-containing protein n=1 Tax=Bosea sp. MMO-172 TaxID=3127885 RepID=UPI0030186440